MSPNKICNSKQMADVFERERERVPLRIQSWFHSEERKSVLRLWLFRVRHMLSVNRSRAGREMKPKQMGSVKKENGDTKQEG